MRESFSADGNDLAGHQGGVICGGIFAYRALVQWVTAVVCVGYFAYFVRKRCRVVQQHTA